MAKLVTVKYEYAQYDDAQGTLVPTTQVPPKYPPTLDTFAASSLSSAINAYGSQRLTSTGAAQSYLSLPATTLTIVADVSNTTLLWLQQSSVIAVPGAAATQLYLPIGPGQTLVLPGVLNSGSLVVQPVTSAFVATTAAWALNIFYAS